jgi:NAD(P)H dehydrogenase (quinone)
MNILVVYAHHEPTSLVGSLKNAAVSSLQANGHEVTETDLYALGFHPVANKYDFNTLSGAHFNYMLEQQGASSKDWGYSPDIVEELQKLQSADLVLFYMPVWWSGPPAILKGWLDRILCMGVAWDSGKIFEQGLYRNKRAMVVATTAASEEDYQPLGSYRATMKQMLHSLHHATLAFCGFDVVEPFFVFSSMNRTGDDYAQIIESHRAHVLLATDSPRYLSKY